MEGEQLKLLGRSVVGIDTVVADAGSIGLKIFVDDAGAIGSVATVLDGAVTAVKNGGRGPIQFCLMGESLPGEVEVQLEKEFPVTPQIKGAIKSLDGVLAVEEI
jgi:DNA polymerase-3 subunit alpha